MSPNLNIFKARPEDADALGRLNKQLLEDENNWFQPSVEELAGRMANWIAGVEWHVDIFRPEDGGLAAYIVHQRRFNPASPGGDETYVRQFAVDRAYRRTGLGLRAIELFVAERCTPGVRVLLDVLETNPAGQAFWDAAGFKPFARILTLTPSEKDGSERG